MLLSGVTLFEKQKGLVPIQSGNTQRIIHPHIYDWPDEGSENETSELPFLNWSAGACNEVFHRVIDEFNNYVTNTASEILKVKDETSISSVCIAEPAPDRARVEISSDDGTFHDFFDIVLVAVGFGLETRSTEAGGVVSYWQNDDLEQVIGYTKDEPEITLVSGSGDGALIDCLRAKLLHFNQNELLEIIKPICTEGFVEVVHAIEEEARQLRLLYPKLKYNFYCKYEANFSRIDFSQLFHEKTRKDRELHLNFKGPEIFSQGSSPLNRVLIYGLIKSGEMKLQRGDLDPTKLVLDSTGRIPIKFSEHKDPVSYNRVIIRHGVNGKHLKESIPSIWEDAKNALSSIRELELTSRIDNDLIFLD